MNDVEQRIADELLSFLRENPDVCGWGSTTGYSWFAFADGEWRAVTYGGPHRLSRYVRGVVLDEARARKWVLRNPVNLIPAAEAGTYNAENRSVWGLAEEQDVFADADRCFWCGASERAEELTRHETTEQGVCAFCADCLESWGRADEIIRQVTA